MTQLNRRMNEIQFLEVKRKDNLHFLVQEMERWRGIIGDIYPAHKQIKTA